jgi:ketosteroid isomerase-like protein
MEAKMLAKLSFNAAALLLPTSLLAQGPSTSHSCAATEQALLAVAHDFWAAYNHRDVAALDKLLDDRLLFVGESGNVLSKAQFLAPFRVPEGSMKSASAEQPEDVRTLFADNTAFISFLRAWTITHQSSGASFGATSRMTETFICRGGEWKVIAFQETMVPNPARQVYRPAANYLDDFVGKYRFGEDARGGDIAVTRQGNRLYESWGIDEPVEILPGKFDMFFTPGFPILERFVRDRSGRVVGIVYTLGDSEVEAKRLQ